MTFRRRAEELTKLVRAVPLNVLVWGPGPLSGHRFDQRAELRDALNEEFPNADVRFSEDDEMQSVPDEPQLTFAERELWHLAASDLCVVLDVGSGPGEETAHFVDSPLAYKLLVLTPAELKESRSFPASLREGANQMFFTDTEFADGDTKKVVLARARQVALGKLIRLNPI